MSEPAGGPAGTNGGAPVERGWGKLILALLAFFLLPFWLHVRAFVPVERTMLLYVPALAACTLVGWWAGGRVFLALVWVGMAVLLATQPAISNESFYNLARGWSLLLAGSFGLVCLFGTTGPFFPKALVALGLSLVLALVMSSFGPVSAADAKKAVAEELSRRNGQTMAAVNGLIERDPENWRRLTNAFPWLAGWPARIEGDVKTYSDGGAAVFPAVLALQSLAALALAWATYHRLGRARLGPPLGRLGDF
ncbi:MAG TPA: hypothetical protein VFZ21_27890, partial [Gemmatimonadaceae bacterium]|nr:hypothetical protein [Gemmatimonadaceae bacterium]